MVAHVLAFVIIAEIAIGCSAAQEIVLFGDSLSDNSAGYAGNAKYVLRTNQARVESCAPNGMRVHRPHIPSSMC